MNKQEEKKGFPIGVADFSRKIQPVSHKTVDQETKPTQNKTAKGSGIFDIFSRSQVKINHVDKKEK